MGRHYRTAIELDSKYAMAHNNLGTFLRDVRNNYDDAERHYRKAIELDPKYAHAHNNLGKLFYDRKDYVKAEEMYRKAIELEPTAIKYWNLSDLLEKKNDINLF